MTQQELLLQLNTTPELVQFSDVIQMITTHFDYQATRFKNGDIVNEAGSNEGSCRLLYFAHFKQLSETQTLHLFGDYYRQDVLANPSGSDHGNIRNFMKFGWQGVQFEGVALAEK